MDEVSINVSSRGDEVTVGLQALDPSVLEHDATLSIRRIVEIKRKRGVDSLKTLLEYPVEWSTSRFV